MRYFTYGIVVVLVLGGGWAAGAATQERLIVPGHSIGSFSLGQDLTDLRASLGSLYEEQDLSNDDLTGYFWPVRRIGAIADRTTNRVVALAVSLDDTYLTDNGVAAGVTREAVRRAYGPEDTVSSGQAAETLIYDALGLAFDID